MPRERVVAQVVEGGCGPSVPSVVLCVTCRKSQRYSAEPNDMHMDDELELLDQAQIEAEAQADEMEFASDLDRRRFVFLSLTAAAASTFGFGAKALAQG